MERAVHGGAGLVNIAGKAGFVQGGIPGESVRIEITRDRSRRFEARLLEIITPSPDRVTPRCPHFWDCGGCDWQHIAYTRQLQLKTEILKEDFARIGGMRDIPGPIGIVSGSAWKYRGRVQLHTGRDRPAGFKARRSRRVVPVDTCPVARDAINRALASEILGRREARIPLVEDDSGVCITPRRYAGSLSADRSGRNPAVEFRAVAGRTVAGRYVAFDPAAFFQSNVAVLGQLMEKLGEYVAWCAPRAVGDLYAGAGVLSVGAVSQTGRAGAYPERVLCVEEDSRNARLIEDNLVRAGIGSAAITVVPERVETAIAHRSVFEGVPLRESFLILDPPRGGLSSGLVDWIGRANVPWIAYVSCDSASLARDLARLAGGYTVREVILFDFYPQTAHLETMVLMGLRGAPQ